MVYNVTQTVAAAGTRIALTPGVRTLADWVMLANVAADNVGAGIIYHGGNQVSSSVGMPIGAGAKDVYWPKTDLQYDLQTIYVDSDVSGTKVRVVYGRR